MKTLKKSTSFLYHVMLTLLAIVIGASSGVTMAAASDLPDAGKTNAGADGEATPIFTWRTWTSALSKSALWQAQSTKSAAMRNRPVATASR